MAEDQCGATSMTMAAIIIGLAITENMDADDQNFVANLLFAAAQAISTRASILDTCSNTNVPSKHNIT